MRNTFKKIVKAAAAQEWNVNYSFSNNNKTTVGLEFSKYSPAGQDFSFYCEANTPDEMIEEIQKYSASFDTEEHVEMFVEAKKNGFAGVPSIRELVDDADKIENMLRELAEVVTYGILAKANIKE